MQKKYSALFVLMFGSLALDAAQATEQSLTLEELTAIVRMQDDKIRELEEGQQATVEAVEEGGANLPAWLTKTTLGGYGEVHYNNLEADAGGGETDEIDVHRFVLYFAHQYSDTVRFFSELELEHALAGDDKPGEVELEQAFIEWDYSQNHSLRSGVALIPVGILNETHEPDTFYGVERNSVEKNIIPTTWWEAGVFFNGELAAGLSYDLGIHSGLYSVRGVDHDDDKNTPNITNADSYKGLRSGRQKVAEANASDFAYTVRLKYTGFEGLEMAATFQHQTDLSQGDSSESISANLYEAHAIYQAGPFAIRALYAMWDIENDINSLMDTADNSVDGAEKQQGFYIEPSYKISEKLGVFARYSEWDNTAGSGVADDTATEQVDVGLNYWLTPTVVLKADYQDQSNDNDADADDGFNLGVGWSF